MSTSHDLARAGHDPLAPTTDPTRAGPAPGKRAPTDRLGGKGEPRGLDAAGAAETAAALDVVQQRSLRSLERVPEAQRGALRLLFMSLPAVSSLEPNLALANLAVARSMLQGAFALAARDELGRAYVDLFEAELERCRQSLLVLDARNRASAGATSGPGGTTPASGGSTDATARDGGARDGIELAAKAAENLGGDGPIGAIGKAVGVALDVMPGEERRKPDGELIADAVAVGAVGTELALMPAEAAAESASMAGASRALGAAGKTAAMIGGIASATRHVLHAADADSPGERNHHLLDGAFEAAGSVATSFSGPVGLALALGPGVAQMALAGPMARTSTALVEANLSKAFARLESSTAALVGTAAQLRVATQQSGSASTAERRAASVRLVDLTTASLGASIDSFLDDCLAGSGDVSRPGSYPNLRELLAPLQALRGRTTVAGVLAAVASIEVRVRTCLARRRELLHDETLRASSGRVPLLRGLADAGVP